MLTQSDCSRKKSEVLCEKRTKLFSVAEANCFHAAGAETADQAAADRVFINVDPDYRH